MHKEKEPIKLARNYEAQAEHHRFYGSMKNFVAIADRPESK